MTHYWHVLVVFFLSLVGVLGDLSLKMASDQPRPFRSVWFAVGTGIFALTAIGWLWAFSAIKISTIGGLYSVSTVLLLVTSGVFIYGEQLSPSEMVGCGLAVVSLFLLGRHA